MKYKLEIHNNNFDAFQMDTVFCPNLKSKFEDYLFIKFIREIRSSVRPREIYDVQRTLEHKLIDKTYEIS